MVTKWPFFYILLSIFDFYLYIYARTRAIIFRSPIA